MEKKQYIAPEMEITEMGITNVLCVSQPGFKDEENFESNEGDGSEGEGMGSKGRYGDLW